MTSELHNTAGSTADKLYKVVFDYETDKDDELCLKAGEIVRILNGESSPDWWLAERADNSKEAGLIPSNFIEKIPFQSIASGTKAADGQNEDKPARLAIVIEDYIATSSEKLNLEKNKVITVLDQNVAEGWWKGDLNGKIGLFPADHVELVGNEQDIHETPTTTIATEQEKKPKKENTFKLASYGVKQGGIGSILAGGFGGLKRQSHNKTNSHENGSIDAIINNNDDIDMVSSLHQRPRSSLSKDNSNQSNGGNRNTAGDDNATAIHTTTKAIVLHSYHPESDDEIQLIRGEYITIVDSQNQSKGWWKGTNEKGATGIFPANFVELIKDETPPSRPARLRPPTVKTEQQQSATSTTATGSMAQPPPVPIKTRPTSLLTNRESINQKRSTQKSNTSALPSPAPAPRPLTTPPIPSTTLPASLRPLTVSEGATSTFNTGADNPPIPARRTRSVFSPRPIETTNSSTSQSMIGQQRIPSIPLRSPDLPPISPGGILSPRHGPIPRRESTNEDQGLTETPLIQSKLKSVSGSSAEPVSPTTINTSMLAKPPKLTPGSSFLSSSTDKHTAGIINNNSEQDQSTSGNCPPVPKRSVPPVPAAPGITTSGNSYTTDNDNIAALQPERSTAFPFPANQQQRQLETPNLAPFNTTNALNEGKSDDNTYDEMEKKIRDIVRLETDKLRKEFEQKLQEEVQKLRLELEAARKF
ncbi:hypothetical protein BDF20DRAFT_912820 [Mycotypha africana]|uniref:uncharacterized protein n=1 Tax=Mycotypha africana TaxID=64632 RepID=UPI002300DBBC|nr:uncharacterized protein BDF20DRAFT_912820 [Mycotypha africana]KAI8979194.1 hypothetical protein BDF20DRAFT_912820 [Mycotypha africana]